MGTRHFINIKDGRKKIMTNYGQWDGYPTGQGKDIQEWIKHEGLNSLEYRDISTEKDGSHVVSFFANRVRKVKYYTKAEVEAVHDCYEATGALPSEFSRDTGAKILYHITDPFKKIREPETAKDYKEGLSWCEWEYTIDISDMTITTVCLWSKRKRKMSIREFMDYDMERLERELGGEE